MDKAESRKWIPLGIEDYKEVARGCHYIDKTALIADICDTPLGTSFLFTRPRRFGKSLALSMLESFFRKGEDSLSLFENRAIAKMDDGR